MLETQELPGAVREIVERYWLRLVQSEQDNALPDADKLTTLVANNAQFAQELCAVWSASDYVAQLCIKRPSLLVDLVRSGELERSNKQDYKVELTHALSALETLGEVEQEAGLKRVLRHFQQRQMLRIIWRDVCNKAQVLEICADISALADAALDCALNVLHATLSSKWGEPIGERSGKSMQMVVIGMGKLGANELNLSSDIDLMFAYPESGETRPAQGESIANQQFFTRLGQALIDALDTVTPDGFVFRVDMRLRPYGSEGALVCSFDSMETYYQNQGRDWERYALIKGRIVQEI